MYEKGRAEEFAGKNLHSIYITESYWATATSASRLYSTLMGAGVVTMIKIRSFIINFHTFFNMTCVEIGEDDGKLINEIEKSFNMPFMVSSQYRRELTYNKKQLLYLISLWFKYNVRVQQNPIMDIIRHTTAVGDKEI